MGTFCRSKLKPFLLRAACEEDSSKLGALHVEAWRESYPGLIPAEMLASLSVESRTSIWKRILCEHGGPNETSVFLGNIDAQLAGFVSCGLQRSEQLKADGYTGEISVIYILRAFQNRGGGRQLMATAIDNLRERGCTAAGFWVLRDNRQARSFYERLGGRQVGERQDIRGEHVLVEVAYGWSDLR